MTPGAIKESAKVSFSLSFLLQLVGVLMAGVWGYSQLDARISTIANASAQHTDGIARIEDSMEKNQDAPISSDHIQNTKLNWLESVNADVLKRLDRMEMRMFEMRNRDG
jgi:hypothetical protein|tara:strand:- start:409 stop:735 length:327 start_codon:yes stop_codon:yes gene_type:complete